MGGSVDACAAGPVVTYNVHEHLQPKLYELYENDNIFDKFECCFSGNDLYPFPSKPIMFPLDTPFQGTCSLDPTRTTS